ncbi:MAG: anhydro-N-acetylmuramic acid kinase [Halanaerobiales bacterium]|nr:anhydro-N-acetylmuramic acid kinase [Halanaerobiales bacterium]
MGSKKIIGLMSGTSVDGIDAALVEIHGSGLETEIKLLAFVNYNFPLGMREEILSLCNPETAGVDRICKWNFIIGEEFAKAAIAVAEEANVAIDQVDLIGSHGQTIYHDPRPDTGPASTLQIGAGGVIAEKTGVTTISNFRIRDMAAGGQGAPLVPYVDFLLFRYSKENRILQNIGGIGNYTLIPANGKMEEIEAVDTGPGNMVIDGVVNHLSEGQLPYDRDGNWACQGQVDEELVFQLLAHPYFSIRPPKTTGREMFGLEYVEKVLRMAQERDLNKYDLTATVTALTARSIARCYNDFVLPRYPIHRVLVSGGGSYNPVLMEMLQQELLQISVESIEEIGWSSDAKEAIAFAVLANETLVGNPSNVSQVTGAKKSVILGDITPGDNFADLVYRRFCR